MHIAAKVQSTFQGTPKKKNEPVTDFVKRNKEVVHKAEKSIMKSV
jgi:hypothetical protein